VKDKFILITSTSLKKYIFAPRKTVERFVMIATTKKMLKHLIPLLFRKKINH